MTNDKPKRGKDTLEQKAARQRKRRKEMKNFAAQYGYTSWEALATALVNGQAKIVKVNPQEKP